MLVGYVGSWCFEFFFVETQFFLGTCHNIGNSLLTGTYYCVNMVLITMSSFLCVFVVNMSVTGTRYPVHLPKTLKKVCIENVDRSKLDNASTKHLLLLWVFFGYIFFTGKPLEFLAHVLDTKLCPHAHGNCIRSSLFWTHDSLKNTWSL